MTGDGNVGNSTGDILAGEGSTVQSGGVANTSDSHGSTTIHNSGGGDVISGGALAYWDGQNVVGMVEVNTTESGQAVTQIPYHPIEPAHVAAVQALAATTPHVAVSDSRVQARLLSAPAGGAATVMAANRWDSDCKVVLHVSLGGRRLRLPSRGSLYYIILCSILH